MKKRKKTSGCKYSEYSINIKGDSTRVAFYYIISSEVLKPFFVQICKSVHLIALTTFKPYFLFQNTEFLANLYEGCDTAVELFAVVTS